MIYIILYGIPCILSILLSIAHIKLGEESVELTRGDLLIIVIAGAIPAINIIIAISVSLNLILNSKYTSTFCIWADKPAFKIVKDNK